MKLSWTKAALGAAALACVGAANAYVIDFESGVSTAGAPFAPLLSNNDTVTQGGYEIVAQELNDSNGTLVGALVNGANSASCLDGSCPTGNATNYITSLNDGIISVQTAGNIPLVLSSFSAAFLPAAGVTYPSGQAAYLAVEADRADGSYAVGLFSLNGPNATTGLTSFASFSTSTYIANGGTGTLTSGTVTSLFFYGLYCNGTSCSGFNSDKADFALDNIAVNVPVVPEPSDWLLMAAGLAGVSALVRRRSAA